MQPIRQQQSRDAVPLVSIVCSTYNHEKFIRNAIEGFLIQETNFIVEILIHDDASTDLTAEIIKEYHEKHPELIFPIYQKVNQKSLGLNPARNNYRRARGAYVAICEGDDYWTDPLKLQKQVDFLEKNNEFVFCVHRCKRFISNKGTYADDPYLKLFLDNEGIVIDKSIYAKYWLTQPLTAMIRRESLNAALSLAGHFTLFRDIHLFYLLLRKGNGFCMNFIGGVYNVHDGGMQGALPIKKQIMANYNSIKELYLHFQDPFLEFKLINNIIGLIRFRKSIAPLFMICTLNVKLLRKIHLFNLFAHVAIKRMLRKRDETE